MKSILIVCLCMWGLLVYGEKNNTVHLYGSLKEFKAAEVNMAPDGAAGEISDAGVIKIPVDADGNFDLVLPLSKPAYFRIGRNTLYLTPGDELKVYLGTSQPQSTFEGTGMEANTYLKGRLFPKAGSFLSAGRNLRPTFEATKKTVDSLAALRMKELEELKNVSKEFKLLEKERIKADVANSYMSFAGYSDAMLSDCKSEEEFKQVLSWLKQAAQQEHPEACYCMGALMEKNHPEVACKYYEIAANRQYIPAMLKLALLYDKEDTLFEQLFWMDRLVWNGEHSPLKDLPRIHMLYAEKLKKEAISDLQSEQQPETYKSRIEACREAILETGKAIFW